VDYSLIALSGLLAIASGAILTCLGIAKLIRHRRAGFLVTGLLLLISGSSLLLIANHTISSI